MERIKYNTWIKPAYGNKHPSTIIQKDFDSLMRQLKEAGKAAQTIKHIIGLFDRLIKFSSEKGYCHKLELKITLPRINNEKTEDLTHDQIKRLLEAIAADPPPFHS